MIIIRKSNINAGKGDDHRKLAKKLGRIKEVEGHLAHIHRNCIHYRPNNILMKVTYIDNFSNMKRNQQYMKMKLLSLSKKINERNKPMGNEPMNINGIPVIHVNCNIHQ